MSTGPDSAEHPRRHSPVDDMTMPEMRGLLIRNWLTHDAMWFATAVQTVGIDQANHLNRTAARSMAAVEAKRIRRLIGIEQVRAAEELRSFFDAAIDSVIPDFMDFEMCWSDDCTALDMVINKCFAFDGVTLLGVADTYECGIFERVRGWMDGLGVAYEETPRTVLCTMHHDGACGRRFEFELPGSAPRSEVRWRGPDGAGPIAQG